MVLLKATKEKVIIKGVTGSHLTDWKGDSEMISSYLGSSAYACLLEIPSLEN